MIFLIYTILMIFQQIIGISTITVVPDPCPNNIQNVETVVDMCKSSFATEENHSGNDKVDSVILRIMIQQDNCICRVTIDNQIETIYTGLKKIDGLSSSAPEENQCGLAVDINHIPDISTGNVSAPIECIENVAYRTIPLLQNSSLEFKSRIINGTFTRGYCMQIIRDNSSDSTQVLRIDCDPPMTTKQTTEETITFGPTPHNSGRTTGYTTFTDTSIDISPSITTTTEPTTSNTISTMNYDITKSKGIEETTYIAISAGSGVALVLLVVLVVICLRKKSTHNAGSNGSVNNSYQQEESDDKLQNNVLYVPATEFDITDGNYSTVHEYMPRSSANRLNMEGDYSTVDEDTAKSPNKMLSMDGNYSTIELDEHLESNSSYPENSEQGETKGKQKPTIKPKPKSSCINSEENRSPDQNIQHITPPNGSDSVYAIIDKSSKNVPTTNGSKGKGKCQPDQTYAVVDKTRKYKSSADETNKKKFEINSGNRVDAM